MEKKVDNGGGDKKNGGYWWWGIASSAQMAAGIGSYRSGYNGDGRFMPLKAFTVASLFVGAGATAFAGFLNLTGIHKVCITHHHHHFHPQLPLTSSLKSSNDEIQGFQGFIICVMYKQVEDLKLLGANIRRGLGVRPRETK